MCFGLSGKNKLYFDELLIKAGVNSFGFNVSMSMLLYVTVGTRPHLHFCSLDAISSLDPLRYENNQILPIECALPRPLERGAKLVTTVPCHPKVVIQLPRGNLEAFEPRPMILSYASGLLDKNLYYDCLVMLRRQKVDLNFLVDYNPRRFIENADSLVRQAVSSGNEGSDLLSLLVSSLEEYDSTLTKYPIPGMSARIRPTEFESDGKVNCICTTLRKYLIVLPLESNSHALHSTLCSFARQRPPLLVEALKLIRDMSVSLQSPKSQSALRYLAFLAESTHLFDAALKDCDFDMARAIAKLCQMDPKVYMALLESFESIGSRAGESASVAVAAIFNSLMRYKVHEHLAFFEDAVAWCIEALSLSYEFTSNSLDLMVESDLFANLNREIIDIVSKHELYAAVIPKIKGVLENMSVVENPYAVILSGLLSHLYVAYGRKCVDTMDYAEAVASFLSAKPACPKEAVRAARLAGDWNTAIAIAGRYRSEDFNARNIARELVIDFREALEQGEYDDDDECGNFPLPPFQIDPMQALSKSKYEDRASFAARLCLDYLGDTEGAVSILISSRKWLEVVNMAIMKDRFDLLSEDISTACTDAVKETIRMLKKRSLRHVELVDELHLLWKDATLRLQQVSSTETGLSALLLGNETGDGDCDDARSEFTADTRYSHSSFVSNASFHSDRSLQSNTSGVSSVSVLSHTSSRSTFSKASTGDFSIEGLDHSLLSRGTGDFSAKRREKDNKEKKKRRHKSSREKRGEGRSEAKDVWGLRNELTKCESLLKLSNVGGVIEAVTDLRDALLLLNSDEGGGTVSACITLASQLQKEMDSYIQQIGTAVRIQAPSYPTEWLKKRNMTVIRHFQGVEDVGDASIVAFSSMIDHGVNFWRSSKSRRVSLSCL